ncbi:MAG TPA: ATP-binding protein [Chitinophagaceae bacterium]|nr:ATP-binding protein [Chitinophagaceae bacterium]
MDNYKNIPITERIAFLESELKRLEQDLAQKNREIEVEKALEKVRSKALDMRSSSELSETSTILFQQLKELKIDAIRSGVGIFDDENNAIELWITSVSDEGRLFFILDYINIHVHPVFENIIEARKARKSFATMRLEGKELAQYYKTMSTYAGIPNRKDNIFSEYYYSFFFSSGTINVVSGKELTNEETNIMLRFANAFGLMYTRFLDLKRSEDQAGLINEEKKILESTLSHLKATQNQLIQSEKMASLGELTAGIAHEIQNPLNFVNNFSEVNSELIAEMKDELTKGNIQEAKTIANGIDENEQKIIFHGKRADAIVKGMLQHSRSSSSVKVPTNINALADEYLRLAYHGLRAKDKSFNATMKTDYDESIGNINIVPQDIGRVILNLITNAFYAAHLLLPAGQAGPEGGFKDPNYEHKPTVWVSTKKAGDKVLISVRDNGPGIPQKILDKIFQPFFTTKPTGQGTGLGLSLSYDIVKAHGGEIKVETKEGEGSAFSIILPL